MVLDYVSLSFLFSRRARSVCNNNAPQLSSETEPLLSAYLDLDALEKKAPTTDEAEAEANANVDNDSDSTSDVESIVTAGAQRLLDIEKAEQRSRNNTISTANESWGSTAPGNNEAWRQRIEDGRVAATEITTAVRHSDYRRLKNWKDTFVVRAACARRICELCLLSPVGWYLGGNSGGNVLSRLQKIGQVAEKSAEYAASDADAASDGSR